ncbi:HlyD family type I secretion periplasmic adaptor subunit [Aestuariispira ectoiniformans]|uniref:HlyD family type I secretion periplasmic adaptor subunit n=1 Tax=Aestuariispira ectoiniformans TaxID=2775080 RepID=UPI00223B4051|nr:HlyD family type I secretion periplasmic adaptor subunit [Aestuariispira ectoiniformans]
MSLVTYNFKTVDPTPTKSARRTLLAGGAIILVGVVGFFLWSALAPLSSAAVSRGHVSVYGYRKAIQHLEGGIVRKIAVENGSEVKAGDLLIRLDDTRSKASLNLVRERYFAALAEMLRLKAERDGKDKFELPPNVRAELDQAPLQRVVEEQRGIFEARQVSMKGSISVLEQKIKQLNEEISGLKAEIKSYDNQSELISDEVAGLEKLYAKGLVPKRRLRELQRRQAAIRGKKGSAKAGIARAGQKIGETKMQIEGIRNERMEEVSTSLRKAQQLVAETKEKMLATEDVLTRVDIRAPAPGVVVGLQVHTEGAVISPGQTLMEIVPESDKLIVETRIKPQDIDSVHPGLPAEVRLSAYDRRTTPPIDGEVFYVSADRVQGEQSPGVGGEERRRDTSSEPASYYTARITLDPESLAAAGDLSLYPGMPADVMVVTGKRTLLDYILTPVGQVFERALREE